MGGLSASVWEMLEREKRLVENIRKNRGSDIKIMEAKSDATNDVERVATTTTATTNSISKEKDGNTQRCDLDLSSEEQRCVLRKIDLRVAVVLGVINCISLMDRGNLGAAAVAGMSKDLDLGTGNRYSIAALIFFVPYLVFEFPSTILARRVGPRLLLTTICMLWGVLMIGTGFVTSWKQLAGLRALLGFLEAAYFPVVVFLLGGWYTRYEVQKRYALFFLITISLSSFGGILAYGFMQMHGLGGVNGWRWTFIMEGILTVLIGVVAGSLVVDFPDKARSSFRFLTNRQIDWVMHRLREDRGDVDAEPFTWGKFLKGGRHFEVWLFAIIFCCCTTVAYCVSFFLPIILHKDMGFSKGAALCLSTPPYVFAAFTMFASGWLGDKYRVRSPILLVNSAVAIIGLVLLGWTKPSGVRYLSIFVINGGVLANIPTAMAYQANNIRGQWIRAFGSAAFVVGGGMGGVFGALVFGDGTSSASISGICGCIGANLLIVAIVLGLTVYFRRQNRLAKQGAILIYGHPGFLYSL